MVGPVARRSRTLGDVATQANAVERHLAEFLALQQGYQEPSIMCHLNRPAFKRERRRLTIAWVAGHLKPTFQERPMSLRRVYEAIVEHLHGAHGRQPPQIAHGNAPAAPLLRKDQRFTRKLLEHL